MEYLAELGYLGLFIAAFLAATILPLSSEALLSVLLLSDFEPKGLIATATLGNVLGALLNYALGYWGSHLFARRVLKISDQAFVHAEQRFRKYGAFSLLFAWVPIIGDPLTLIAGVLRINLPLFVLLVTLGKWLRYVAIALIIG